jgi:uncharacterized protein YeaC (DUF1315 family)
MRQTTPQTGFGKADCAKECDLNQPHRERKTKRQLMAKSAEYNQLVEKAKQDLFTQLSKQFRMGKCPEGLNQRFKQKQRCPLMQFGAACSARFETHTKLETHIKSAHQLYSDFTTGQDHNKLFNSLHEGGLLW